MASKGIHFENRVEAFLCDLGYNCDRDTNGAYDILALAPWKLYGGACIYMIECKSSTSYDPARAGGMLRPEPWNGLVRRAEFFGATPLLATGKPYSKSDPDFWQLEGEKPGGYLSQFAVPSVKLP